MSRSAGRPWRRAAGWLALLAPFFYLSYGLANQLAASRAAVPSLVFGWEHHIPFWDWTIFPYWSVNVFYGLSLFIARSRHELDRHGARLLTAQCIAVACFIAFPLHFSFGQPEATGAAGLLFAALRGFDQPFNQAPSLHIALAVILWDLYRRVIHGRIARCVLHAWVLAICGSVLTTYQHHFIDIPTGALLGVLCVWAWPLERRVAMARAWRWTANMQRQRLARRYAAGAAVCGGAAAGLAGVDVPLGLWLFWPAVSLALVALNYAAFGARGFQMDARGRMAWPARWLLAPYRLAARLNGWAWTRRLPPSRELMPGVWIGSLARLSRAELAPSTSVVSLCAELQAPDASHTHCLPWLDLVPATPQALKRAAAGIEAAVQRGDAVFVGCALGFSRSAAAVACWMARSGRARDVDDALAMLHRLHPQAVLGPAWQRALRQAAQP
jgi:protein-tyrosine phosphatase